MADCLAGTVVEDMEEMVFDRAQVLVLLKSQWSWLRRVKQAVKKKNHIVLFVMQWEEDHKGNVGFRPKTRTIWACKLHTWTVQRNGIKHQYHILPIWLIFFFLPKVKSLIHVEGLKPSTKVTKIYAAQLDKRKYI